MRRNVKVSFLGDSHFYSLEKQKGAAVGDVCLGDGLMCESWGQVIPAENDGGLCFREAYPNCTVLEARPCYNVARLMFLDAER